MASILKVDTIQDQAGNNIINENANVITIGASGDTITSVGTFTSFTSTGIDDNATSTAITIDSNNNIGVGTASPTNFGASFKTLELKNASGDAIELVAGTGVIAQTIASNTNGLVYIGSRSNHSLLLTTNDTERMRIDSSGNVGIGTSSPDTKLHVQNGDASASSNSFSNLTVESNSSYNILQFLSPNTASQQLRFGDPQDNGAGYIQFNHSDNSMSFGSPSERMRITSSGNVGIGTSIPAETLSIASISSTPGDYKSLAFQSGSSAVGYVRSNCVDGNNYFLSFGTYSNSLAERMRIDATGNVFTSKTADDFSVAGIMITNAGGIKQTVNSNVLQQLNRLGDDGSLIKFYQAGGEEGTITVSGSTVSYNGFTGTHWSRFTDNSTPTILRGTVLESLDEMCDWYNLEFDVTTQDKDGNDVTTTEKVPHVLADGQSEGDIITYNYNGTDYQATIVKETDIKHMMSKVSDTVDAKNVYGLFVAYDLDGEGYNDFYVASVGSYVVRIKSGETLAKGDLLQSNGDGTAKVQTDDNVKSSSFAKVLSTTIIETYEDGSYLVPCSLMC